MPYAGMKNRGERQHYSSRKCFSHQPGNSKKSAKTMSNDTVNRPFSALIHDLGPGAYLSLESFGDRPRFPVFLPRLQTLGCALISRFRQKSVPDGKWFLEKWGGFLATLASHERFPRDPG